MPDSKRISHQQGEDQSSPGVKARISNNSTENLAEIAKLPRSSFYEWKEKLGNPNTKELALVETIKEITSASKGRYGYRRVTYVLRKKKILVNHERVLRLMRENGLLYTKFHKRNRGYSS